LVAGTENEITTLINYTAFAGAAVLLVARTTATKVTAFALILLSFFVAQHSELCRIFVGVFLPTIVHVFIFTVRSSRLARCADAADRASHRWRSSYFVR